MIHIKVQYDAYNRTLNLVDKEFGTFLEDSAVYDLAIPCTFEGVEERDIFAPLN